MSHDLMLHLFLIFDLSLAGFVRRSPKGEVKMAAASLHLQDAETQKKQCDILQAVEPSTSEEEGPGLRK